MEEANFDIGMDAFSQETQGSVCDNIGIEQISSDEELDLM